MPSLHCVHGQECELVMLDPTDELRFRTCLLGLALAVALPACAGERDSDDAVTGVLGGRLHWDFARFDNDTRGAPNRDDTEIRRLWLDFSGRVYRFGYKLEADFSGLQDDFSDDGIEARDVYVTRDFPVGRLTVGQFKPHFSLDDRISSDVGVFMERGMFAQELAPSYRLGAAWLTARDRYTVGGGLYSLESIDEWQVKGRAFDARATWAPQHDDGRVLHLGLSAVREYYDHPGGGGAPGLRIRPRPAGHLSGNSRVTLVEFDAGRDTDADKATLEFGLVRGPWYLQSEIGGARFDDSGQRGRIDSAYVLASWFVTGESMPYDSAGGRFGRITPRRSSGAWQLALRYDTIRGRQHLDGADDFRDVSMDAASAGVNWYLRPNLRLMLDYTRSRNRDRLRAATLDRTDALSGRFQFDF